MKAADLDGPLDETASIRYGRHSAAVDTEP
jgi:hypothetical protein